MCNNVQTIDNHRTSVFVIVTGRPTLARTGVFRAEADLNNQKQIVEMIEKYFSFIND